MRIDCQRIVVWIVRLHYEVVAFRMPNRLVIPADDLSGDWSSFGVGSGDPVGDQSGIINRVRCIDPGHIGTVPGENLERVGRDLLHSLSTISS